MRIPGWILTFLFVSASAGIAYSQTKQDKPAPTIGQVFFGAFEQGKQVEATTYSILKTDSLSLGRGVPGKIVSFDIYTKNDSGWISETAFGNRFSKKQKVLIDKLPPGAIMSIHKIIVKYPGKNKMTSGSVFTFKIKR